MRSFILLCAVFAFAAPADAGLFDAFRFRSNHRVSVVRVPNVQGKAAVKFRYECGPNGCRIVPVNP